MKNALVVPILRFWVSYPALFYGISLFLGVSFHFTSPYHVLIPSFFLWIPFLFIGSKEKDFFLRFLLSVSLFCGGWLYANVVVSTPTLPRTGIAGTGKIAISQIRIQQTMFGESWVYRCHLTDFVSSHPAFMDPISLSCQISFPLDQPRLLADCDYAVSGVLKLNRQGIYRFKLEMDKCTPIRYSYSFAEFRFNLKRRVMRWIEEIFEDTLSSYFLAGLVTGEFDDHYLKQQFSRFGLQHILAISGFHFGIVASFLSILFRLLFSKNVQMLCLLFFLGIYCLFLGPQSSILRSWMMCSAVIAGNLLDKQTSSLNLLGGALIGVVVYDPSLSHEIAFQFSFAITAAILLFYRSVENSFAILFYKKSFQEIVTMRRWDQHAHCVLSFLKKGVALTLAVNIWAFPLTLYYFHEFPMMSLFYNLFYPLFVALALCLFLISVCCWCIPWIGNWLMALTSGYTHFILQLTYQIPVKIDSYFHFEALNPLWLILYLCIAGILGILFKERYNSKPEESESVYGVQGFM